MHSRSFAVRARFFGLFALPKNKNSELDLWTSLPLRSVDCVTRFVDKFVLENHQHKMGSSGGCHFHVSRARLCLPWNREKTRV